jgi:hypothetical protein
VSRSFVVENELLQRGKKSWKSLPDYPLLHGDFVTSAKQAAAVRPARAELRPCGRVGLRRLPTFLAAASAAIAGAQVPDPFLDPFGVGDGAGVGDHAAISTEDRHARRV